jgi:hypothetical protein
MAGDFSTRSRDLEAAPFPSVLAGGRYRLLRRIGEGGMGVVFEAFDRELQIRVAIKTLHYVEPDAIYALKNEFRSMADVVHPNLVGLHELVADGDLWFIAMELVDGVSFVDHLRADPRFLRERCRDALRQVVAGVEAIHAAGKLHLDIKPSNVLVTPEHRVVILDFGLVRDQPFGHPELTRDLEVEGTPLYMAPEQARGETRVPATDWYAVGAMLYKGLTGRPPFPGSARRVLESKQKRCPPAPAPSSMPASLRRWVDSSISLMSADPAVRPSGRDILVELGHAAEPRATRPPRAGREVFVGRELELERLEAVLRAAMRGASAMVLVHGPSGIGKTTLVRRFSRRARDHHGALVLSGRCYERESVPFKALDGLVDGLTRHLCRLSPVDVAAVSPRRVGALSRLFPVLERVEVIRELAGSGSLPQDPKELRRLGIRALRELLGALADRHPVVLHIDDIQWGDLDSVAVLAELLRGPNPPSIMVVSTHRTDDQLSPCLRALAEQDLEDCIRREIPLGALPLEAMNELVDRSFGGRLDVDPALVTGEAHGNPYFVAELARFIRSDSGPDRRASRAPSWKAALLQRIRQLSPVARELLEVIAVAARRLETSIAFRAVRADETAMASLRELSAEHLIRARPTSREIGRGRDDDPSASESSGRPASMRRADIVEAYHDRIREIVLEHLDDERIAFWHGRLAEVLESSPDADPEQLAAHHRASGQLERAAELSVVAGEAAREALAFNRAAELFRAALALGDPTREVSLRARRAEVLALAGRSAESSREYMRVADVATGPEAALFRRYGAEQLIRSGRIDDGLRALNASLVEVGLQMFDSRDEYIRRDAALNEELRSRGLDFEPMEPSSIPRDAAARLDICWSTALGLSTVDGAIGGYFNLLCVAEALEIGDSRRLQRGLGLWTLQWAALSRPGSKWTAAIVAKTEELANTLCDPESRAWALFARAAVEFWSGRLGTAVDSLLESEGVWRDSVVGAARELASNRAFSMVALLLTGRYREVAARYPELTRDARERDDLYLATWMAAVHWGGALAADDPRAALQIVDDAEKQWSGARGDYPSWMLVLSRCNIELYLDAPEPAWARLEAVYAPMMASDFGWARLMRATALEVHARATLAVACIRASDRGALIAAAEQDIDELEALGLLHFSGHAELLRGRVRLLQSDPKGALRKLELSAELFAGSEGNGALAAGLRLRLGEWTGGRSGRRMVAEAKAVLDGAGIRNHRRWLNLWLPDARWLG